jgi:hypothetical protein
MAEKMTIESKPSAASPSDLPFSLLVELTIHDSETIGELCRHQEGESRDHFAADALRIGVLALKQARGQVDADLVRRETDRLLQLLDSQLSNHAKSVHERLTDSLQVYFDPETGRFHERVERLVRKDGELEDVIRRQVGQDDSELAKTLAAHFGVESPLMKLLSPDQSQGLLASIIENVDTQLETQREHVVSQFSLDNKEGALARFIDELTDQQGELSEQLHTKIDEVVRQFSLDDDESALSRLVRNVERAQKTITNEFSLDEEGSALARLKKELATLLEEERENNRDFQEEVRVALQRMETRKKEAERSTRHGVEFEEALFEALQHESQRTGDIATATGATTGLIRNCKVGDCLIELGPDNAAAGSRIVVEAKEKQGYGLAEALKEIETARKNRDAGIGLFVFSAKTAPEGFEPVTRYGSDVMVVWDAEDAQTDLFLRVGLTLARALSVRGREDESEQEIDFTEIDRAILEIEKRVGQLDDIDTWANTILKNSEKILDKIGKTRKALSKQVDTLQDQIVTVKTALSDTDGDA